MAVGSNKQQQIGGSSLERPLLPKDFYRFLGEIDSICVVLSSKDIRFRQAGIIASNIKTIKYYGSRKTENLRINLYYGMTSRECFQMFYEHIQQPYKIAGDITLGLSVTELKQLDDTRLNADNHTKFTTGKFDIKEWRII